MTAGGTPVRSIRDELCRLIRLNEQEQWVPADEALEGVERFGNGMIPGLIECLRDGHSGVRHLAVELLLAARPRSNVAVPALIERMADEDWLVITTVMYGLGDFGPLAAAAIPQVEGWLESPNEYLRTMAATTIIKLDPSRAELLPMIWDATKSDHPMVQLLAREFFDERTP